MAGRKSDFTLPTNTLDELFSTLEERDDAKLSKIRDIPLELIDDFPDHPFKVRDDEDTLLNEAKKMSLQLSLANIRLLITPKFDCKCSESHGSQLVHIRAFQLHRRVDVSFQSDCRIGMTENFGQRFDFKSDLNGACGECVSERVCMNSVKSTLFGIFLNSVLQNSRLI